MKTNCTILFLLLCLIQPKAQIITTYAGGGAPGDGGPANLSRLTQPYATAFDTSGNLYIADYYGHRLRKISVNGIITTVAGNGIQASTGDGGQAKLAQLAFPSSVTVDKFGNIYVAEGHRIRKITPDGIINSVAGNGASGYNGDNILAINATLNWPQCVTLDTTGNIFIADINNYRVRKVNSNGIITTIAGTGIRGFSGDGGPASQAQVATVTCVAIDTAGNIIIADGSNYRIRKININGIISTIAGTGVFGFTGDGGAANLARISYPSGVMTDKLGNIYISDRGNNRIRKINSAGVISTIAGIGTYGFSGDGGPALNAKFAYPEELSMDEAGNIYVADSEDARVRKIDMNTGIINTIAGSDNYAFGGDSILASDAELNGPTGIAADREGNVYIADFNNVRVRKISKNGVITTVAGGGTTGLGDGGNAKNAQLYSPVGITVDKDGNLYIADRDDNRVRKVATNGIITTIAGTGVQGFSGDGSLATNAQLYKPYGVAVDTMGNIFISDQYNYRIRKITPDGIINTVAGTGAAGFSGDGEDAKTAMLYFPAGLAADKHGNIFIADQSNYRVRKLDHNNIITTVAGGGGDGVYDSASALLTDLYLPIGVKVDSADNIYIAEFGYPQVRKVSPNGLITSFAGNGWYGGFGGDGGSPKDALLKYVQDVVTDADGNVYISDGDNNRVRKVTLGSVASISGDTAVCRNSTQPNIKFNYTGSSIFAPYTFTYRINGGPEQNITTGGGNTALLPVPTVTVGTFVFTLLRVADNNLYTTIQNGKATVTIGEPSNATITSSGPVKNICPGKTVTLRASAGKHYSWNNGDTTASITVSAAGRYFVTVTNTYGCTSVSASVNVTYTGCTAPTGLVAGITSSTQAKLKWKAVGCASQYKVQYRKQGAFVWTSVVSILPNIKLKKLTPGAVYEWQVATICDSAKGFVSSFSIGADFTMPSGLLKSEITTDLAVSSVIDATITPNPAQYNAIIHIKNAKGSTLIILSDITGNTLWKLSGNSNAKVKIPLHQLNTGVYIVTVQDSKSKISLKLVKE